MQSSTTKPIIADLAENECGIILSTNAILSLESGNFKHTTATNDKIAPEAPRDGTICLLSTRNMLLVSPAMVPPARYTAKYSSFPRTVNTGALNEYSTYILANI